MNLNYDLRIARAKAFTHFSKRALERHGITITWDTVERIIQSIKNRESEFLAWVDNPDKFRSFYRVRIFGEPYIVVYDFEIDALITILHNSWLKKDEGEWKPYFKKTKKYRLMDNRSEFLRMKKKGLIR